MKDNIYLKNKLLEACSLFVDKRHLTITTIMESSNKALQAETKSSAGDKHETGRAMLQLEIENASQQLSSIQKMTEILNKINYHIKNNRAKLGSLIITNKGNYFLSISAGVLNVDKEQFYAVSTSSPIGTLLIGKSKGDSFLFNGKEIEIIEVL
ncbi:MAG: 3-oxoacyl-ACP synthase [Bacteroidetes bacterium]|nr:MAG: 3-oxoacyl-ACP synthase [Bacteroidota bacterium]